MKQAQAGKSRLSLRRQACEHRHTNLGPRETRAKGKSCRKVSGAALSLRPRASNWG